MTFKAIGRSALLLAAGLFVCFAGPSPAAAGAEHTAEEPETAERPSRSRIRQTRFASREKIGASRLGPGRAENLHQRQGGR